MKRFLWFLGGAALIVVLAFGIFKVTNKYSLDILNNNIDWSIYTKGCEGARSFTFDDKNNLFIANATNIKIVNSDGKEEIIINDRSFDIYDIIWHEERLYISTDHRILEYNLKDNTTKVMVNNIPNYGKFNSVKLNIKDNDLYISIPTNTNSGIVEKKGLFPDVPTMQWTLSGKNYGVVKTGSFFEFGKESTEKEKVQGKAIGNGSIMKMNIKSGELKLYAHGLKNIEGMDFNSVGELFGIVSGMEDIGPRNVKDDSDYIYAIEDQEWYGWPDYSGGDPITSGRFSDGSNKLDFLILNHPTNIPQAPKFQSNDVNSLKGFAIDKKGDFFLKDTMIVGDNLNNKVYAITTNRLKKELVDLGSDSKIEKIKMQKDGFYLLDSKAGCIYNLQTKNNNYIFNLPRIMWIFIIGFIIVILVCLVYKFNNKKM